MWRWQVFIEWKFSNGCNFSCLGWMHQYITKGKAITWWTVYLTIIGNYFPCAYESLGLSCCQTLKGQLHCFDWCNFDVNFVAQRILWKCFWWQIFLKGEIWIKHATMFTFLVNVWGLKSLSKYGLKSCEKDFIGM